MNSWLVRLNITVLYLRLCSSYSFVLYNDVLTDKLKTGFSFSTGRLKIRFATDYWFEFRSGLMFIFPVSTCLVL